MPSTADTTSSPPLGDPTLILHPFAELPDPRRQQGQVHLLEEIIFMAVCAVICSADSCEPIAEYSRSKIDWLQTFLTLSGAIPSHDTFGRVFCLLEHVAFQKGFYHLSLGQVATDAKSNDYLLDVLAQIPEKPGA